jgi:hypothetical protein
MTHLYFGKRKREKRERKRKKSLSELMHHAVVDTCGTNKKRMVRRFQRCLGR